MDVDIFLGLNPTYKRLKMQKLETRWLLDLFSFVDYFAQVQIGRIRVSVLQLFKLLVNEALVGTCLSTGSY